MTDKFFTLFDNSIEIKPVLLIILVTRQDKEVTALVKPQASVNLLLKKE